MVYLATVIDQYEDPRYGMILEVTKALLPGRDVFEPAIQNWDTKSWLADWAKLQHRVSALVIWPRRDGTIGRGVYTEWQDLTTCLGDGKIVPVRGIPVIAICHAGDPQQSGRISWVKALRPISPRRCRCPYKGKPECWNHYAKIEFGQPISERDLPNIRLAGLTL